MRCACEAPRCGLTEQPTRKPMDILAHGLWAGIGIAWARRRWAIAPRTAAATVALAIVPDLMQLLPLLGAAVFGGQGMRVLSAYATALPGLEPALPPLVAMWSHHLHCIMHSAIVAAAVTAFVWAWRKALWLPLLGWWSHIVIDVFSHSADFYPSPVLYPITQRGFDGVAWNTPAFLITNYAAMTIAVTALVFAARQARTKR
jgi:hypothetical protein